MIQVNQYIKTGFSADDAKTLLQAIQPIVDGGEKVVLDFSEIKIFTTLFFNNALAKFVVELGPDEFNKKFEVKNLSEIGQTTYQHSMDNAKDYYKISAKAQADQADILSDFEE